MVKLQIALNECPCITLYFQAGRKMYKDCETRKKHTWSALESVSGLSIMGYYRNMSNMADSCPVLISALRSRSSSGCALVWHWENVHLRV